MFIMTSIIIFGLLPFIVFEPSFCVVIAAIAIAAIAIVAIASVLLTYY